MHPAAATVATLIIFFLPGLFLVAAFAGSAKKVGLTVGEQLYLTLAGSIVVSGWIALGLAGMGVFTPLRVAALVAVLVVAAALVFRKRLAWRPGVIRLDEITVLVSLVVFGLAVYFPPFDYVFGGRDPGVYVNTGFHVARAGNLMYADPLIRSIPEEDRALFFRTNVELPPWRLPRFQGFALHTPETGLVSPQGLHLYPVWIGVAAGLFEDKAGLYATPFFALLGVVGLFLALRRLLNPEIAFWAAAIMTVFQIQIWFARFPNSEILVQFLYATALLSWFFMEERGSRLAGALSGAAFGSTLLVRVESLLFLIPLGLYFGWKRLRRELGPPGFAFLVTLALVLIHGVLHARYVAWPYVTDVLGRHYWRSVGDNLPYLALLALVAFLALDRWAPRLRTAILEPERWRPGGSVAALGLFLVACYAYFVRPIWHGARTAPHDAEAFFRMSWYFYPLGLALVVGGAMVLVARADRRSALLVLVGLTFSLFFFYKVRVWHDHYFAMRRFIPVILPTFFVCIGVFLSQLRTAGRLGRSVAPALGGLLVLLYAVDGSALWRHREFPGSREFVRELARHLGDNDVVIFPRQEGLHLLELPLSELEGRNVLEFYTLKPDRALLEDLMVKWSERYGDIYFVTNYKIWLSGFFTQHVKDFWLATQKYEFTYDRPPKNVEPFHLRFTLSKAVSLEELAGRVPGLPFLDVGGSDDLQVAWFHEKEREEDGTSYRWSQRVSSVFLPALDSASREIVLRLAGPKEIEAPTPTVRVALNDEPLGTLTLDRSYADYRLSIPEPLRARLGQTHPVLSIATETWRPSNSVPGATDVRDLGVRVDWVEVN